MPVRETIREPARDTSVFRKCDVLVLGGGPAGSAAAASAAKIGADTILVERYGHLGGMSSGGLVLWIDRMTDWKGNQVIAGFANDLLDRLPREAILGPLDELWGSRDPQLVEYWRVRQAAFYGIITWSPTVDSEMLKIASIEIMEERGVKLLLHSWAVDTVKEDNEVRGVIFESKSGRQAILAKVIIDATGDGDIFAHAGAEFDSDVVEHDIHHRMNTSFIWRGVDMERYLDFRRDHKDEFRAIMARGKNIGVTEKPSVMPRNDEALFMGPRLKYNCLDVEDLTTVEIESRRRMMKMIDFYRKNMPGFENAIVKETADQMGTRHSRRLVGVKKITREDWSRGVIHEDEIAISPPSNPRHRNFSVPLGCLMPIKVDNLLAAGRCLSCDPITHTFMREIPQCWSMGQAAGVAAAIAINSGVLVRDVDVREVRRQLRKQGAYLHKEEEIASALQPAQT